MSDAEDETQERYARAEAAAVRFLARRDYSVRALRDKLVQREHDVDVVAGVLCELEGRGWLDDGRFAQTQAEILYRQCWGPRKVVAKLVHHGVAYSLAEEVVSSTWSAEDWKQTCRERLRARFDEAAELDRAAKGAAYRHLERRGYDPWLIRSVLFDGDD